MPVACGFCFTHEISIVSQDVVCFGSVHTCNIRAEDNIVCSQRELVQSHLKIYHRLEIRLICHGDEESLVRSNMIRSQKLGETNFGFMGDGRSRWQSRGWQSRRWPSRGWNIRRVRGRTEERIGIGRIDESDYNREETQDDREAKGGARLVLWKNIEPPKAQQYPITSKRRICQLSIP